MWRARPLETEEASRFRAEGARTGLSAGVHASYLINLGCDEGDLREKSIAAFCDELERCDLLGVDLLVVHPGAHPDRKRGVANVAAALDSVFERHRGRCTVLLETAAGQGSSLGRTFEELGEIRERVAEKGRVAFCFDTCHVFASGYDLSTSRGYEQTFRRFDDLLGLCRLKAFHLNDSKKPLGCRVDRHERPGEGCIGSEAFRRLVNDEAFASVPGYLELPPENNREVLRGLAGMRGKAAKSFPKSGSSPRIARRRAGR